MQANQGGAIVVRNGELIGRVAAAVLAWIDDQDVFRHCAPEGRISMYVESEQIVDDRAAGKPAALSFCSPSPLRCFHGRRRFGTRAAAPSVRGQRARRHTCLHPPPPSPESNVALRWDDVLSKLLPTLALVVVECKCGRYGAFNNIAATASGGSSANERIGPRGFFLYPIGGISLMLKSCLSALSGVGAYSYPRGISNSAVTE